MRNQPTNSSLVHLYWHVFYFAILPTLNYSRVLLFPLFFKAEKYRTQHFFPLLQLAVLLLLHPMGVSWASALNSFFLWWLMHGVSFLLLIIFSTPVHRSEHGWTEGCGGEVADFGKHTILSTHDYLSDEAPLWLKLFAFASFNDHVIHHCFPTVDLSRQVHDVALKTHQHASTHLLTSSKNPQYSYSLCFGHFSLSTARNLKRGTTRQVLLILQREHLE